MDQLTAYFVRHYTLVIDNDQSSYWPATEAAKQIVRDSGITRAEWLALSTQERADRFAPEIGSQIMDMIGEWFTEAVSTNTVGGLLASEIMILGSGEIEWHLGAHYVPEDADILDLLDDEDE